MTADRAAVIRRRLSKAAIPADMGTVIDLLSHADSILQPRDVASGVGSKHLLGLRLTGAGISCCGASRWDVPG